jgi:hypothetical protein
MRNCRCASGPLAARGRAMSEQQIHRAVVQHPPSARLPPPSCGIGDAERDLFREQQQEDHMKHLT